MINCRDKKEVRSPVVATTEYTIDGKKCSHREGSMIDLLVSWVVLKGFALRYIMLRALVAVVDWI